MTAPDFSIEIDSQTVPVLVRRHPRARRLRLRFDPIAAALRLTLPPRTSPTGARRWAEAQQDWIRRQLQRSAGRIAVADGTLLPWRDGQLRVCWQTEGARLVRIEDDRLLVGGPADAIGRRIGRWLAQTARADFADATHRLAERAGLACTAVSIGDPRGRWGSCSSRGAIRYSWRLIMAPDVVRRAIVAHEVAHLRHMDHGPRFHALVDDLLGDDAAAVSRDWLRRHGVALHALDFG